MLKKIAVSFLILCVSLAMIISAHSATVDGTDDGFEWDGALAYQLIKGESNCDVDYAVMKLIIDNENRTVDFCFLFRDPKIEPDNVSAGVSFSVNDSDAFVITGITKPDNYDTDKYSFEGEISVDENHGVTCEIRLGFKEGVPQNICGSVSFIDGKGMPSNKYDIVILNEGYTERTVTPIGSQNYSEKSTSKTTKSNSASKTNNKTETLKDRTSNRRTTTERIGYTTEEFLISTSPPYSYSRTSKPSEITSDTERKSTEKSTVKHKSTTEHKSKINKTVKETVTVYYYEKEIIIYSDIPTENVEKTTFSLTENTTVEKVEVTTTATTEGEVYPTTVSVSDGIKYKTVIGVISAILIIILAAWASRSGKKAKDTSNQ